MRFGTRALRTLGVNRTRVLRFILALVFIVRAVSDLQSHTVEPSWGSEEFAELLEASDGLSMGGTVASNIDCEPLEHTKNNTKNT